MKTLKKTNRTEVIKRLIITIALIAVFRFGASLTLPGSIPKALIPYIQNNTSLSLMSTMSGSGLTRMSLFALGISPYITASIIVQVWQTFKHSKLYQIAKHGHIGQLKLNKITRKVTIIISALQGFMLVLGGTQLVTEKPSIQHIIFYTIVFTGGSMITVWLSDQITEYGLGNGVSLLIATGILAQVPSDLNSYLDMLNPISKTKLIIAISIIIVAIILLLIVVFVHLSEYRIPIITSNKHDIEQSAIYLPIKLNPAGINPTLFANALIIIPGLIISAFNVKEENLVAITNTQTWQGASLYLILIAIFAVYYSFVQVNAQKISENLKNNDQYINNVRAGDDTKKYILHIVKRLSIFSAVYLVFIIGLPIVAQQLFNGPSSLIFGGSGLVIVVTVFSDLLSQIKNMFFGTKYKDII